MTAQERKDLQAQKDDWVKANEAYFNKKKSLMSDSAFDTLTAVLERKAPKWLAAQGTGAKVDKKTEVELIYFMPSLTKFYPEKIDKRLDKSRGPQIVLDKLDGSALQLTYQGGKPVKLVTRGNGTIGGDISFLIPYLTLPTLHVKHTIVFRCEAVMRNKVFAKKYADKAENARALVNGALNRKTPSPALKHIDIVVLGVYGMPLEDGLEFAERNCFVTAFHEIYTIEKLRKIYSKLLELRRQTSDYDMDGLVAANADAMFQYDSADKPKWTYAFKVNESVEDATKATVKRIIWQTSRKSLLVPKVEIEPIRLGGTTVTYATLHNARWMIDKGVGPGSVIKIVRSGDVIPKIVDVVRKAKPQMPDIAHEWRGVHLAAVAKSKDAAVREIHHFMKTMGMEFLAAKTIAKLYDVGLTTVAAHLEDYANNTTLVNYTLADIGDAMTKKIVAEYKRVFAKGVLLRDLMVASNMMEAGIGERKLKAIEAHYKDEPNVLAFFVRETSASILSTHLHPVAGFKIKTGELLVDGLIKFRPWLKEVLQFIKVRKPEQAKTAVRQGRLAGELVSFTGYRDKAEAAWIEANGGQLIDYGSKTTILLYRLTGKASNKVSAADAKGIKTMTFEELQ